MGDFYLFFLFVLLCIALPKDPKGDTPIVLAVFMIISLPWQVIYWLGFHPGDYLSSGYMEFIWGLMRILYLPADCIFTALGLVWEEYPIFHMSLFLCTLISIEVCREVLIKNRDY